MKKWSKMEDGERDCLIYEKVLGIKLSPCSKPHIYRYNGNQWVCTFCCYIGSGDNTQHRDERGIPDYSTNLNFAFELIESGKFSATLFNYYKPGVYDEFPNIYEVSLYWQEEGVDKVKRFTASGKTLADTICYAMLRVYGVEIDY